MLNPYSKDSRHSRKVGGTIGTFVDEADHRQHAADAEDGDDRAETESTTPADLVHRVGRHSKRQRNDERGQPQVERRKAELNDHNTSARSTAHVLRARDHLLHKLCASPLVNVATGLTPVDGGARFRQYELYE
jgi:hypothetical protein